MKIPTMMMTALVLTNLGAVGSGAMAQTLAQADAAPAKRTTSEHTAHTGEKLSAADFVKKAAAAGNAEVAMGKLGAEKATNAEVKAFAQRMVTDHTKANKELATLASSKKLEVPTEPDLVHKGMNEKFEHQSVDKDFHHDFMQQMVRDHEATVELFSSAAGDATLDVDLRAFANKTLPTLKQHLAAAQKLEAKLAK